MFAEEQPALGPLPLEPFRYYRFGVRTVHLDGCVEVEAAYYGTPPGWIGRRVDVQWNDLFVRLLDPKTGQLREHVRAPRGWHRIADADRPRRTPPKTVALLEAAMRIGPSVSTICDHIHRHEGEAGVRRILGVLSLAKKHGPAVIEDAAKAALDLGVPTYRFLRRYLERRPPVPLTLRRSTRSFVSSPSTAISSIARQETMMNLIELDRALRQLRLSGMAAVLDTRCGRRRPRRWRPSISCPRSSPTNSAGDRTVCSSAGTSSRAFAIPSARSTPLTLISTRR